MNKKKKNKKFVLNGWMIIVICFVFIFLVELSKSLEFNPDEGVCSRWVCSDMNIKTKECSSLVCVDYRTKTKCELDPNNPECVCEEEYYPDECTNKQRIKYIKNKDGSQTVEIIQELINDSIENIEKIIKEDTPLIYCDYNCIKAHEPNECEKGEDGWIWQNNVINNSVVFGQIIVVETDCDNIYEEWCITTFPERFCRKKTIYDYSCEEIKKSIIVDGGVCIGFVDILKVCWGTRYSKNELYNILIEKGCEI